MLTYVVTRNELQGSKLISKATKREFQKKEEVPSHFAIIFDDRWVFHSNFANGVHIEPYKHFIKRNKILKAFKDKNCCMTGQECNEFQDHLIEVAYGSGYDWFAIAYLSYRIGLNYTFNVDIPEKNKWESSRKWFCNELFELKLGIDLSMKSPNDIMFLLYDHEDFEECEVRAV